MARKRRAWRLSTRPVRRLAEERGIDSPSRLAEALDINYRTARKIWLDDLSRAGLHLVIIERMMDLFDCEIGDLFVKLPRD